MAVAFMGVDRILFYGNWQMMAYLRARLVDFLGQAIARNLARIPYKNRFFVIFMSFQVEERSAIAFF